jgi:hypothetical protein
MSKEIAPRTLLDDTIFRRIVVVSTAIAFAATAAVGASFRMDQRMFVWHWSIPIWMLVGVVAALYLWKLALRAQRDPSRAHKRNFTLYSIALCAVAVLGFLWPVLFVAQEKFADLSKGLITAAIFLGGCGAMLFWFIKNFKDPEQPPV